MHRAPLLLILASLAFAVGCKGSAEAGEPSAPVQFDEVVYRFQDASVPPEHHRSFTITVNPDTALRVVDSYGDEIERSTHALKEGQFAELVSVYEKAKLRAGSGSKELAGCTGGTGETLRLLEQGKELVVCSVEHCGGEHVGDCEGDFESVAAEIKSLTETLAESP